MCAWLLPSHQLGKCKLLPAFDAAVRGDKGIKRESIVALVQVRYGNNLQQYRCEIYRAKDAVVDDMEGEW